MSLIEKFEEVVLDKGNGIKELSLKVEPSGIAMGIKINEIIDILNAAVPKVRGPVFLVLPKPEPEPSPEPAVSTLEPAVKKAVNKTIKKAMKKGKK